MSATEDHNRLAPELLRRVVEGTGSPTEMMVVVESLVMGACLYAAGGKPRDAGLYLDQMTQAVTERLTSQAEIKP